MIKINSNNPIELRNELPKEFTEEFLLEAYDVLKEDMDAPEIENDPENYLKLSVASWMLHYYLEGSGREVTDSGSWYVYLEDDTRQHEDHEDYPNSCRLQGHWPLKKGEKPHPLDYKIPCNDDDWDDHVTIDLHLYYLKEAHMSNKYSPLDCEKVSQWATDDEYCG